MNYYTSNILNISCSSTNTVDKKYIKIHSRYIEMQKSILEIEVDEPANKHSQK